jgi:cell division protein FtsW
MRGAAIRGERIKGSPGDFTLASLTFALFGAGLATLLSASSGYSMRLGREPESFFVRQLMYAIPAAFAYFVCARYSLERLKTAVKPILLFSLLFLLAPFAPVLGKTINGATRWVGFGPANFQPSELFKYALVLYMAHILSKKADRVDDVVSAGVPPLIVAVLGCLVIYAQNDLSTAAIIGVSGLVMFWIARLPWVFFVALATVSIPLAALSVLTSDFRLLRVISFLVPGFEPYAQGYQVMAAQRAVSAGGLFGEGFGLGTLKNGAIPEVQSDFVFAAYAEELGLVGVLLFFALWGLLAWRGFRVAFSTRDTFNSYLAFGLTTSLVLQALTNVAVVVGALPATGIALPFFSAGGSSLLMTAAACGLLYNLSRSVDGPQPAGVGIHGGDVDVV